MHSSWISYQLVAKINNMYLLLQKPLDYNTVIISLLWFTLYIILVLRIQELHKDLLF